MGDIREPITFSDDDGCCICYEQIFPDTNSYIVPECQHSFHTNCIVEWFRRGNESCPKCRRRPNEYFTDLWTQEARYKFNRRFAIRKTAPKDLKNAVAQLRKLERKQREEKRRYREWKQSDEGQEHKRLSKIALKMRPRRFNRRCQIHRLHAEIAEYPIIPMGVPRYANTQN